MEIQPIVIGTAGHIDHGKSTLVRALTGIDPDRLKEEKERGLTIDLGFAPLELPDGRRVGIVDVPGHERFIRNMVAGASGIDLVVLVVAADDGVMPQTREHLQIMELLGVRRGFVALTKVDMVDEELVALAEADVEETVAPTFLAGAPILRVSGVTGDGIPELKEALFALAAETEPRSAEGVFRMPVQRVFSKQGLGTVVTGVPVSGEVKLGDVLELLPAGVRGKVRGLQAYKESTDRGRAGHSTAINLTDVDRGGAHRGNVVATPNFFTAQRMVAARLTALPTLDRAVTNRMPIRLHTGTSDPPGEVILLDQDEIAPGESGLVQLRLEEPVVCAPGDRFVMRLLSPVVTLGGGVILEESRYRLKRFKGFVLEGLERQEESLGSPAALLESVLARAGGEALTVDELAVTLKRSRDDTRALLDELLAEGRVITPREGRWIHPDRLEAGLSKLRTAIDAWFRDEPHRLLVSVLELRRRMGVEESELKMLVDVEVERGGVEPLSGGRLRVTGEAHAVPTAVAELADRILAKLVGAGFQPPSSEDLASGLGAGDDDVRRALETLIDREEVVHVGAGLHLSAERVEAAHQAVVRNCEAHGHLEIPALRDELGTSRKFLIPLLEHFDARGVTLRQGAHRVLRRR
ncbi:MAG: selenocysteine-specific translation elongation factor [Planctomycetota bacterium]